MKYRYAVVLCFLLCAAFASMVTGAGATTFYLGADLSYVNEMEDCGAVYRVNGEPRDPYQIFADYGANLVRLRLWNDPTWTAYSTLDDVIRSSRRAQALGMGVLLDFHYSDTWADPGKQIIPAAWADITDLNALGAALYQYTYDVLATLDSQGLMPEIVQVGNEINSEILRAADAPGYPINWERNAFLLNEAIRAVRDAGAQSTHVPRIMLHIAQPENVEGWFLSARQAGVTDYDVIGISYYPKWSLNTVQTTGNVVRKLRYEFDKEVMVVETAYPWTFDDVAGSMPNDFDSQSLEPGYPATSDGQKQFLIDLAQSVFSNGGLGLIYWEPAWVSTPCRTLWGTGSSRDNATFFDFENGNEALPALEFLQYPYQYPVDTTLSFRFDGSDVPEQIYFWGDFTSMGRRLLQLARRDGEYVLQVRLLPGTEIQYQFYQSLPASAETALIPANCLNADGYISVTIPEDSLTVRQTDSSCPSLSG